MKRFLTISIFGRCDGALEITDFVTFSTLGGCGGLEITDFLTVSTLGICGGLIL